MTEARWTNDHDVAVRTARKQWTCEGNGKADPDHAPDCSLVIGPGDRYVEYLGEATAYSSGSRHSMACAVGFGYVDPSGEVHP